MSRRLVNIDRETPLLLPVDLREWVADNELAHFVLEAVEVCDLRTAVVNERGSGSAQYPPGMLLAVLIYCYATGVFSSRRIERGDVAQGLLVQRIDAVGRQHAQPWPLLRRHGTIAQR